MCLIDEEGFHKNLMVGNWGIKKPVILQLYTVYVSKKVEFDPYFGT